MDTDGEIPSHEAALNGHKDAAKELLEIGADVNFVDNRKQTVLPDATNVEHCDVTKEIEESISSVADINVVNGDGKTPLHLATCNGFINAVKLLLNNGADVNIMDSNNCTALHDAVNCEKHDVMTELLNFNADVNAKDSIGDMPLHIARRLEDEAAVNILINHGATTHANVHEQS